MILAFNKPYGVLSQFTAPRGPASTRGTSSQSGHRTLAAFGFPKHVYPVGRLDWDSEGLLLLSDEKKWNDLLLHPRHANERTYHVQVEGLVTEEALKRLREGLVIQDYRTRPSEAELLEDPRYPPRRPPIRFRLSVPTSWIELKLTEGKNRQVRRMTAAVGFPTLRLIRVAIGAYAMEDLPEGKWRELDPPRRQLLPKQGKRRW